MEAGVVLGDADELVVFGDALAAGEGTSLDFAGSKANGEMGDGCIFRLARAVRHDGLKTSGFSKENSGDSFRESADLVWLDQDGIGGFFFDAAL